jgi:hypothetical protein
VSKNVYFDQAHVIIYDDKEYILAHEKIFHDEYSALRKMAKMNPQHKYKVVALNEFIIYREGSTYESGYNSGFDTAKRVYGS